MLSAVSTALPFASSPELLLSEGVFLDLEIDPAAGALRVGAFVREDEPWLFGPAHLADAGRVVEAAPALIGHNLRRFDLPHLEALLGRPFAEPNMLDARVVDTLELASIVFPGQPSQALDKLYRAPGVQSDPAEDCRECAGVLRRCLDALPTLPPLVRGLAHRLLPPGLTRAMFSPAEPDWDSLSALPVRGDWAALRAYVEGLAPGRWDNLGALVFVHWLFHLSEPVCRRPAWVEAEFTTFAGAEAAALTRRWSREDLRDELQAIYGPRYDFRAGQLDIVETLLAGEAVPLGLLPTGGGKSLTFQFPALLLSRHARHLSVIVSPLQALMEDQVLNLRLRLPTWGERVAFLSSGQTPLEQREVLEGVWNGQIDVLYLSPERLRNAGVQRLLRHRPPALWVLDEAHTLSQWGMDFRPDFLRLPDVLRTIHGGSAPPLLGFVTATATQKVVSDLEGRLVGALDDVLHRPLVRVPENVPPFAWRTEIRSEVREVPLAERPQVIVDELLARRGAGVAIVYVRSRARSEEYAALLGRAGLRAAAYHARLSAAEKLRVLQEFGADELDVVVATNAFGMGIDRAGIHTVIHAGPPSTPESYVQETGRAARVPGEQGFALLLHDERDYAQAFELEKRSRIGGPKVLKDCWGLVKKRLDLDPVSRWVASPEFADLLPQQDPEELTTQARVALYALEAYDLLAEGEQQPAELRLRLAVSDLPAGPDAAALLRLLHARGQRAGDEVVLDVRETALLAGLTVRGVVAAARQLVRSGHAVWSYAVALRSRRGGRTRLEEASASLRALGEHLREQPDLTDADLLRLHWAPVDADLRRRRRGADLATALRLLRALDTAHHRREPLLVAVTPAQPGQSWRDWLADAEERLTGLRRLADVLLAQVAGLGPLDTVTVNAADLDAQFAAELGGLDALEALGALQGLGVINAARGDAETGRVFYLRRGATKRYNKVAYRPLEEHYADRARRLHALRHVLTQPAPDTRAALLADYFALPLTEFCARHLPDPEAAATPQIPELRGRILGGLSDVQRQVVTDDESRAVLVLAGPGSGKTRTIIHRVANLVALRDVDPGRVLVLAYNRTAVAELRSRLAALIGPLGARVDVLTFHGLARQLTGLSEKDAPRELSEDARFAWLLEQACAYLSDNASPYGYVLVDEYQDIKDGEYELVTRLAAFERGAESDGDGPPEEDEREQPGYLVAVGDDDQNLYGFGGARVEFIYRFRQDYDIAPEGVVTLLDNYRSRERLVACANAFIGAALPPETRLKTEPIRSARPPGDPPGEVRIGRYGQRFDAACAIAADIRARVAAGAEPHDIAVLTRTWEAQHELQHALRDCGLAAQAYNVHDQLRPAASLIGSALTERLLLEPERPLHDEAEAQYLLNELRGELGLSDRDRAWPALLAACDGLPGGTFQSLALRLEAARPLGRQGVVLSTFHSAKGSEFDHVYVLSEGWSRTRPAEYNDETHALYVALTRARDSLTLLRREGDSHPLLRDREFQARLVDLGVTRFDVPQQPLPPALRYVLRPGPADLYISAPGLLDATGRAATWDYGRDWSPLRWQGSRVLSGQGVVSHLRRGGSFRKQLERSAARGKVAVRGGTVLRCERDDEWYEKAGYTGTETHHFHLLPEFDITEPLD